ncbi:MAG: hypothetical protein V1738_06435 [Patescibacteria group bacterium]
MAAIPNPPTGGGASAGAGGAGASPAGPNPNPTNAGRMGSALAGIASFLGRNAATWTAKEIEERWDGLKSLLAFSILVPAALFLIGLVIGRIGVGLDVSWMQVVAKGTFALGSFLGALLVTYLWAKLMIYGHGGTLLSEGIGSLHDRFPVINRARVDRFLVWLRSWTTWFIGALLIFTYVPVYRSVIAALLLASALLLMASIMSSAWNNSPWPRRLLTLFATGAIVGQIWSLSFPDSYGAAMRWTGSTVDGMTSWSDRENRLATVARQATERENVQDAQLMEIKLARQAEIREQVIRENCLGAFCSDEDRAEYFRLEREISALRAGNAREQPRSAETVSVDNSAVVPTKAPAPVSRSGSRLPPPPAVTPTPRGYQPSQRSGGRQPALSRDVTVSADRSSSATDDFGYGGLDDYQL